MWNTCSVCLSHSVESATEAISLALDSVSHALKIILSNFTDSSRSEFQNYEILNLWIAKTCNY